MLSSKRVIDIPFLQVADIELPAEVERLHDLAYNLRWTWNPRVRQLFAAIDRATWARYRNPVQLLLNIKSAQWEVLINDDSFMSAYAAAVGSLDRYLGGEQETWFDRQRPGFDQGPIAYFSMEYGIHQSLPIYSGGLGVLSGDHCKSASDLGLPFVAVGLLYRLGYFRQAIDADGIQQHSYPETDFLRLPVRPVLNHRGQELVVDVPLPGRSVGAKVWLAQIGRVPLLLLDTDIAQNDPADRSITNVLYVRGREARLIQESILGIGGARALADLAIEPSVWHINEGHSSLLQLERLSKHGAASGWNRAFGAVRANTAFTTHTPVPAGNEQFERSLARPYLEVWAERLSTDPEVLLRLGEADHGEPGQPLNLTALAIRTSSYVNGVSKLNSEVGDRMWRHLRPGLGAGERVVDDITNGIHLPTWMGIELRDLMAARLGPNWLEESLDPATWEAVAKLPDHDLWEAHLAQKRRLGRFTQTRVREQLARHGRSPAQLREVTGYLDSEVLTIGFARRFATYKRAGLLFSDLHRLRALVNNPERPVQIILAGKAHPADRPGQELIKHIFSLSLEADFRGRVFFLENYDMRVGRMLVQGCDVWLNTPRRPLEACGTSGMKAAINGVLNFSILDGWWPEAFDGNAGWAIGDGSEQPEEWQQDQLDAHLLYQILEEEIAPRFYDRRRDEPSATWLEMMRRSIATVAADFSSHRMVRDYAQKAYLPLVAETAGSRIRA